MAKTKKFQSDAEGPISVSIAASSGTINFVPGEVRTYETSDPAEVAALRANPDVSEVKEESRKPSSSSSSKSSKRD